MSIYFKKLERFRNSRINQEKKFKLKEEENKKFKNNGPQFHSVMSRINIKAARTKRTLKAGFHVDIKVAFPIFWYCFQQQCKLVGKPVGGSPLFVSKNRRTTYSTK